jgi:HSP20 family protein
MSRMLAGARSMQGLGQREFPPVNLYVNEHDLLLTLEVPGTDPASVDITATGDTVTISGQRPADAVEQGQSFHRRERLAGKFQRSVQLPFEVDPNKTEATYERGVLSIHMGRPESQKPKKVLVKTA